LLSLSPSSIPQGSSGFTLTLNGQGFNPNSLVKWNATPLPTTYSGSVLTAIVPTPDLASSGTASVTVRNPAPGGGDSNSLIFTISPLAPLASLSSSSLVFADQEIATPSGVQTIALQNTGNATLAISGITIAGPDAASFGQANSCGSTLAAGTSCSVSLIFTPTSTGPKAATLSFADNAAGSPQSVPVSGNGISLGLTSTPGGSTSATVAAGAVASYSLSIGGAGFGGVATITCTGAPTGAACSVPNSVNLSATSSSPLTVTVTTKPRSSATLFPNRTTWFLALAVFGLVALPAKPKNRLARWLNSMPLLLLMLVCSCGGGGSSVVTQPVQDGTPAGQYTLTLTASAGSNVQSLPLKLTVQ
jgi:Cep192 domain 4